MREKTETYIPARQPICAKVLRDSFDAAVLTSNLQGDGYLALRTIAPEPSVITVKRRGQFTRLPFDLSAFAEAVGRR